MGRTLIGVIALLCALSVSAQVEAQRRVLVYMPGGDRAVSAAMPTSGPDRAVVTRVTAAEWAALTAAEFASYDLIWIDEQSCSSSAGSTYDAVAANRDVWSPQITGNVVLLTGDSTYHGSTSGFNRNAYYWGVSGTGTGLFASVGCIGSGGGMSTPNWLQGLGTLTYTGVGCSDSITFVDSSHPLITTPAPITPSGMSVGCFFHERWVTFPSDYRAIINVNGQPGVIVRESTLSPNGAPCTEPSTCASGFCVDGVCCDTACGSGLADDCQACTAMLTASSDGTCAPIRGGTVCRMGTGVCDPEELCDGSATLCPADTFSAAGTECRASAGACDPAEVCDGASADCPTDLLSMDGTECRAAAGICDVAEQCSGSSAECPADEVAVAGTECRATMGVCDVSESCDGTSVACPADGFTAMGVECRAAMGACDIAEACTGTEAACPMDVVVAVGTECRASAGVCDVAEQCDGASGLCPMDGFAAAATECRAAAGVCDVAEQCDGMGAACPADSFAGADTECRAAAGSCDVAEFCDGATGDCPDDAVVEDGNSCDDGEICNGVQTCMMGVCEDGAPLDCDDGNACTADMCAEPDGCVNEPIEGCCASDADCADTNECTMDSCDVETGMCSNTPIEGCMEPGADGGLLGDAGLGASETGGCGCSVPEAESRPLTWGLFGLLGLVAWRRRRR